MFATPGNHDWYDGLVSFLRLFCATQWIGGWRTRQRRSYFALQLPNNWWIWAIDIQLDTYIDDVQLQYFTDLKIGAGDKVILLTAKPSWIAAVDGRVEPPTWKYLNFFEERMVRDTGARLALTITGDRHHYARYEPDERRRREPVPDADHRGRRRRLPVGDAHAARGGRPQDAAAQGRRRLRRPARGLNPARGDLPVDKDSRRLSNGILKLAALNPAFGRLLGALYVVIGFSLLSGIDSSVDNARRAKSPTCRGPPTRSSTRLSNANFFDFLSNSVGAMTIVLALALFGAVFGSVDIKQSPPLRLAVAAVHTLVHLLAIALVTWVAVNGRAGRPSSRCGCSAASSRSRPARGSARRCSRSSSGSCTRSAGRSRRTTRTRSSPASRSSTTRTSCGCASAATAG